MTSVSAAKSHVETGLALSEEDIVEVISLNNATPCAPDEYLEDQTKSASKLPTLWRFLRGQRKLHLFYSLTERTNGAMKKSRVAIIAPYS